MKQENRRERDFKELAHIIVVTGMWEICETAWQTVNSGEEFMFSLGAEFCRAAGFLCGSLDIKFLLPWGILVLALKAFS